jgi:hypothetical protein
MTIRVFVGCSANGEDAEAQAMLEYTVRHYTTRPVEISWMKLTRDPASPWYSQPEKNRGWNTRLWATPFSLFRWAIPEVCGFEGKAIYMDVDQIARADLGQLWEQSHPDGKCMLAKNATTFCVILFDCVRSKGRIPSLAQLQSGAWLQKYTRDIALRPLVAPFEGNWNCLDGENYKNLYDPDIKIIHFTRVETQPHYKFALPRLRSEGVQHWNRQAVFKPHARADVEPLVDKIWKDAQAAGYTVEKYNAGLVPFGPYNAVRGGRAA